MQEVHAMPIKVNKNKNFASAKKSHPNKSSRAAALGIALGALLILLPLSLICLSVVLFEVNQWNLPGVSILNQTVAWLNPEETADLIDKTWNKERQIHLIVSEGSEEEVSLSPAELGYWIDPEATAEVAASVGRSEAPFSDIGTAFQGEQQIILPVLYFDEAIARETLESIAKTYDTSPENARAVFRDGSWHALPGRPGQRIHIDATLDLLFQNAFTNLVTETALLVVEPVQPEITNLSPALNEIESVVAQKLNLSAYDPILDEKITWSVPEADKRNWVSIDSKTLDVKLAIEKDDVQNLIQTWEAELGEGRSLSNLPEISAIREAWTDGGTIKATITHKPTTYQVGAGESLWSISLKLGMPMWHILDANPGLTTSNITSGMRLKIPSKNVLIPLTPVENKRIVIDLSDQRMAVYEDGRVRNTHIISSGMSDSPTMAGIFQIQTHEINAYASNWDLWMPHFMGIYEAWPGFMNGIHGLPLLSDGQRLWASSLGSPAS
ncbi:MAG: L,D-transpeptidase family protein, partial [Brevefilum sp.]